jgi:hypothetical protein
MWAGEKGKAAKRYMDANLYETETRKPRSTTTLTLTLTLATSAAEGENLGMRAGQRDVKARGENASEDRSGSKKRVRMPKWWA